MSYMSQEERLSVLRGHAGEEEKEQRDKYFRAAIPSAQPNGSRMSPQEEVSIIGERHPPMSNRAQQEFDRKQAEKKPWKRGDGFSDEVLKMFSPSTPSDSNPMSTKFNPTKFDPWAGHRSTSDEDLTSAQRKSRGEQKREMSPWDEKQMFARIRNARGNRVDARSPAVGFEKLFGKGAKMSQDQSKERKKAARAPMASFWRGLKATFSSAGNKRSWMERLFGARKRLSESAEASKSLAEEGITSTNATDGDGQSWADQLVNAGGGDIEFIQMPEGARSGRAELDRTSADADAGGKNGNVFEYIPSGKDDSSDSSSELEQEVTQKNNVYRQNQIVRDDRSDTSSNSERDDSEKVKLLFAQMPELMQKIGWGRFSD